MKESALLSKFLLEYTRQGSRLFRCNTGKGWTGRKIIRASKPMTVTMNKGDVYIQAARPFSTGWPNGTSDLIGWTKIKITADMVGREMAIFTAVEAKTETVRATKDQMNFIRVVNQSGGLALIARTLDDVLMAAANYLRTGGMDERQH